MAMTADGALGGGLRAHTDTEEGQQNSDGKDDQPFLPVEGGLRRVVLDEVFIVSSSLD